MHSEVNECSVKLRLKGGLQNNCEVVGKNKQRLSINM